MNKEEKILGIKKLLSGLSVDEVLSILETVEAEINMESVYSYKEDAGSTEKPEEPEEAAGTESDSSLFDDDGLLPLDDYDEVMKDV